MRRVRKRNGNIRIAFTYYGEALSAVCSAVYLDPGILEVLFCLCNEFFAGDIEDDSVDRLEIKALVMDVDDLSESKSCGVIFPFILGKTVSDGRPVSLCGSERVVAGAYEEQKSVAVCSLERCTSVYD